MCSPAPVINRLGKDMAEHFGIPERYNTPGPGGVFLGSVGDQAHSTRRSSHNCAGAPGGQESSVNGVYYAGQYAHAWDARPSSHEHGMAMVRALLKDPRVRYVIYDSVGYKPSGETWSTYHPTFHVSMLPGTHDDVRPFFGPAEPKPLTDQQKRAILAGARRLIAENPRPRLRAKNPPFRGRYVREVQRTLDIPETGRYGPGTRDAVKALQRIVGTETTMDLAISAVAGDKLEVTLNGAMQSESGSATAFFDVATIVSGSPVNYVGSAAQGSAAFGIPSWMNSVYSVSAYAPVGGIAHYVVQAGDISGGVVTLRLRHRGGGSRPLYANANSPLEFAVKNLKQ